MPIQEKDVRHVMALARLKLPDDLVQKLTHDLEAILQHVDQLKAVNVTGVEPLTHAVPSVQPLREDQPQPSLGPTGLQGSAGFSDRFVRVPKIMD